jgi:hypothetical protein
MKIVLRMMLPVALGVFLVGCDQTDTAIEAEREPVALPELAPVGATLLEGLGHYQMPITTDNDEVQRWFDQGLMLTYGFNHDAAERSFLKALEIEPECAMCWWGAALVLGPNINAPMDPGSNPAAVERVEAAQALADRASEREQAYIEALTFRYAETAPEDRSVLDRAFAEAMGEVADRFPDDLDAATLHAESLMTMQAWDYWKRTGRRHGEIPRPFWPGWTRCLNAMSGIRARFTCIFTPSNLQMATPSNVVSGPPINYAT